MTVEELIELSDLNRKDNIKYISSEAQGIAIALNSDIYAPTLCKLERAYICGRRKSENHIAELEEACNKTQELLDKQIEATYKLDKENAELKERLFKVENAYKRKSEAEWRLNDLYQKSLTDYANAEKCSREYFTRYRVMMDSSIKAEELLKRYVKIYVNPYPEEEIELRNEAEQFLNEDSTYERIQKAKYNYID